MTIFFTSDTHFGHTNLIKLCPETRKYSSGEDMDRHMISVWNQTVGKEDIVYHLGDFSFYKDFQKNTDTFKRLNGIKHLIVGNHDRASKELDWVSVEKYKEINFEEHHRIILFHYPIDQEWNHCRRNSVHFHGHIHSSKDDRKISRQKNRYDVGWDYFGKPMTFWDIINEG